MDEAFERPTGRGRGARGGSRGAHGRGTKRERESVMAPGKEGLDCRQGWKRVVTLPVGKMCATEQTGFAIPDLGAEATSSSHVPQQFLPAAHHPSIFISSSGHSAHEPTDASVVSAVESTARDSVLSELQALSREGLTRRRKQPHIVVAADLTQIGCGKYTQITGSNGSIHVVVPVRCCCCCVLIICRHHPVWDVRTAQRVVQTTNAGEELEDV